MAAGSAPRIFAVGDIHGHFRRLERLLGQLPLDPERDLLVFLGDYLNRGPQSREVLDLLLDVEQRVPGAVFLMGNHERALLDYAATGDVDLLHQLRGMGLEATLKSYGDAPMSSLRDLSFLPPAHREFLARLRPSFEADCFLFVHAGLEPGGRDGGAASLTVRGLFLEEPSACPQTVVFGHSGFETPFLAPGKIGLDTGVHKGNLLTAVELPAVIFHHA